MTCEVGCLSNVDPCILQIVSHALSNGWVYKKIIFLRLEWCIQDNIGLLALQIPWHTAILLEDWTTCLAEPRKGHPILRV